MSAGQDAFGAGAQGAVPEIVGGAEYNCTAVGRESWRGTEVAFDLEGCAGVRNDGGVGGGGRRSMLGTEKKQSKGSEKCGGDGPRKERGKTVPIGDWYSDAGLRGRIGGGHRF